MLRPRLTSALLALTFVVLGAAPASATSEGHGYLALGDSVAFGTSLCVPANPTECVGYPDHLAQMLNIEDVNASCPGEASGGFISLTGTDLSCRAYRARFQLHVSYTTSQLDFAVSFLRDNPRTRLVTIDIGANDLFVLLGTCGNPPNNVCFEQGLQTLAHNLGVIYSEIRGTGYSGLLVALKYYVVNFADPAMRFLIGAINRVVDSVTRTFGGFVADGFAAFQQASASSGGDTIRAGLVLPGDIHPTALGQTLLAQTILDTILATCPAASAKGCLNRHR